MLPTSANTIHNWIMTTYHTSQQDLKIQLNAIDTAIHFTFNLWTSPNHCALLGVVGHWVCPVGKVKSTVLGLRRFKGRHTGENHALHFWSIICDYNLMQKIGYFNLNNATNNDSVLRHIKIYLKGINIEFDIIGRRLRCIGHVINLVVKVLLWGEDPDAFEQDICTLQVLRREEEEL